MRPIRKLLLTAGIVLALLVPMGLAASADPGDLGGGCGSCFEASLSFASTATNPGRGK